MTSFSYYTAAAVACLSVGGAMTSTQAFSPPRTQTTIVNYCLPSVQHSIVVPTPPSHTRQSCQIISQHKQHKSTSLKSAVEETIETSPEAFNSENNSLHNEQIIDTTPELLSSLDITTNNTPSSSSVAPQELQTVLSSPELLDPISILNATLPSLATTTEEEEELDIILTTSSSGTTVHTTPLDENVENNTEHNGKKKKVSKEEDLELTVLTILRHIDDISSVDDTVLDDEDEEEDYEAIGETAPYLQHLQQNEEFERNIDEISEVVTVQSQSSQKLTAPSITKILRYTIPAIGIWLCSPVLSMIDTAAVGLLSGTAQQAALNPAISVTDYGALVVAFMYTATTNLIAASVQEDKDDFRQDTTANMNKGLVQPKTTTTLITALKLALFVGSTFGAVIYTCGQHLLKLLIGNDSLDPTVFASALRYVQIRSLGMPAMVVIGTAQSACLGMQDVTSPLYVLLAAALINFLGDVLLVPMSSTLFGGAAGAAWATVASQYAALLFFARWLTTAPARNDTDIAASGNDADAEYDGCGGKGQKLLKSLLFWRNKNSDEVQANISNGKSEEGNGDNAVVNVTQGIMELTGTSEAGHSRRQQFRQFLTSSKLARRVRRVASVSSGAGRFIEEAPIITEAMTVDTTTKSMEPPKRKKKKQKKKRSQPKTRGFLSNSNLSLRSYLSLSNMNKGKAAQFLPFVIPVTTTSVGRISGYIAMSHVASSTLGTFDMAGHQIIFSIFCCLTPFVDALSQVAQSFVPAVYEAKERSAERALALRKTINNFRKVGIGFGLTLVTLVSCIPLISRYFTTDPLVLERVNGAIPGVGLFMLVNGLMCAGEGTLLGQKDLKFLRNMYAIFFFAVPGYMLRLKHRSLSGLQNVGIGTMWAAFSTYNVIRTCIWHLRLAQLQRRTQRGIEVVDVGEER